MSAAIPLRTGFVSSQLLGFGYDSEREILAVQFHSGAIYHYFDVPPEIHSGLIAAESKGSYFIRNIKRGPYRYEKQTNVSLTPPTI